MRFAHVTVNAPIDY